MKKIVLLGLTAFATFTLCSCDAFNSLKDLVEGKEQYKFNDFKALVANRNLSFTATKCTGSFDTDGAKKEVEYTYNVEDSKWHYDYVITVMGEEITSDGTKDLFLVDEIKNFYDTIDKNKIDKYYKFYATKKEYTIEYSYKDDDVQVESTYVYGEDGLIISGDIKSTDLKEVRTYVTKESYKYSK